MWLNVAKSHSGGARSAEIAQNVVESPNKKEKMGKIVNMYGVTIFIRSRARTKPGTLLKHQVPTRNFSQWDEEKPGFLEMTWRETTGK